MTLQLLRAGDVFDDIAGLVGMSEPFDARSVEDSIVLSIDAEASVRAARYSTPLARRWLVSVGPRMAEVHARLVDVRVGGLEAPPGH